MIPEREKPQSQIRYEKHLARLARERFYLNPKSEAVAIAKHYASHAILAMQILEVINQLQCIPPGTEVGPNVLQFIFENVKIIKQNHLIDFGLKLEWHPNSEKHYEN